MVMDRHRQLDKMAPCTVKSDLELVQLMATKVQGAPSAKSTCLSESSTTIPPTSEISYEDICRMHGTRSQEDAIGKDGSGWSVAGKGGGGVLPTGAARAGSQLGRKKNASCSGGCAKVDDGGMDVVGGGQGGGVLNTTAAPPRGFVIGISQATGRCSLALFKVGRLKTGCNGSMLGLFPDDDPATWLAAAGVGLSGLKMVPARVKMVVKNVLVQRVWVKMLQEMTLLEEMALHHPSHESEIVRMALQLAVDEVCVALVLPPTWVVVLLGGRGVVVLLGGRVVAVLLGGRGVAVLLGGRGVAVLLGGRGVAVLLGGRGVAELLQGQGGELLLGGRWVALPLVPVPPNGLPVFAGHAWRLVALKIHMKQTSHAQFATTKHNLKVFRTLDLR
eukprot:Em0004g1030a